MINTTRPDKIFSAFRAAIHMGLQKSVLLKNYVSLGIPHAWIDKKLYFPANELYAWKRKRANAVKLKRLQQSGRKLYRSKR